MAQHGKLLAMGYLLFLMKWARMMSQQISMHSNSHVRVTLTSKHASVRMDELTTNLVLAVSELD